MLSIFPQNIPDYVCAIFKIFDQILSLLLQYITVKRMWALEFNRYEFEFSFSTKCVTFL